jgi:hypothetical protein
LSPHGQVHLKTGEFLSKGALILSSRPKGFKIYSLPLIHHQGIICGVAFDRSSLRRIGPYASVVTPRRLASNALLVISRTV